MRRKLKGLLKKDRVLDPMFLPTRKVPLIDWKIDLMDMCVGTKLYAIGETK